jgi:hypothetical protein
LNRSPICSAEPTRGSTSLVRKLDGDVAVISWPLDAALANETMGVKRIGIPDLPERALAG